MIPVLQAEEALATVDRLQVGTGAVSADVQHRRVSAWQDAMDTPSSRRVEPRVKVTQRPTPEALRAFEAAAATHGIGITFKPAPPKAAPDGQH